MNDYLNLIKEYDEINSYYKSIKGDYEIFEGYIQQFISAISLLNKPLLNEKNLKENYLFFFIEKYTDFVTKIKEAINIENIDLITPLKQVCDNQHNQMKKILGSYKKIKTDLFEEKLKLSNAKKEYLQILNENNPNQEIKGDNNNNIDNNNNSSDLQKNEDNLIYDAKKNSCFVSYKYELEKLNEKIDKSNEKYKKLKPELDSILSEKENAYKVIFLKFAKLLGNIGELFIEFKNNLEEKLFKVLNEKKKSTQYNISENDKIKERFQKEKLETKDDIQLKNKGKENVINPDDIIEDKTEEEINKNKIEKMKSIDGMDFEIMNDYISSEDPESVILINESIQKLLNEKDISSSEVSQLLENMKLDTDYSLKFLEELKKFNKNNIILFKNEQNFNHLSNLFNELIISKGNNNELINQIIDLSQIIKYNEVLISMVLTKKNKIISSKKFWLNSIDNNLTFNLIEYINNINNNKQKEIKSNKKPNKKISEKIMNILNNITLYKKLNKKQKIQVEQYANDSILLTISKSISYMSNFSLQQQLIMDILNHYVENFELGIETYYYFENILTIKFQKNNLKMNSSHEYTKEKYGLFLSKEQIIILNVAKFFPKGDYIKLFLLNQSMYLKVRKFLIKYRLTYLDIPIDERIQLWEILLNIKEIKKNYDYNLIKKNYMNNTAQKNYYGEEKKRYLNIVDLDLERTPLFNTQETHKIKANFILKCAATLEPEINYYQGMNYILLFLYQVLNYDEEETFYVFWSLMKQTKFIEVFNDNMKALVTYFKVFEKIIESNYPDIYYSLVKKQIMTQFFATQWFVTLFNGDAEEFEREKTPKFLILAFESFLYYGWPGSVNLGLALCIHNKEKILEYKGSQLMSYMIKDLNSIKYINEEDFKDIKNIFINNSEKINETYVQKLINVINFEEEHPLLAKEEI